MPKKPTFTSTYGPADVVYIKTDPEQKDFHVISVTFTSESYIYLLQHLDIEVEAYEWQITKDPDVLKRVGVDHSEN